MFASSARCGQSKQWLGTSPGERVVPATLGIPQMSFLDPIEPLWCEQMQDMSGYILPETISPPLDEQFDFSFSTAQNENDFYVRNTENPSPEEFMWGHQNEAVLGEDSNMFDNSNSTNYRELHTKMKNWLPKICPVEIDEFAKTSMIDRNGDFLPHIDSENSHIVSETLKVCKKPSASVVKTPKYLSLIDSEEPHIKEDTYQLSSCCTENKSTFYMKDEMEVAEEVVVVTEGEESPKRFNLDSFLFDRVSLQFSPQEEEVATTSTGAEEFSPLSGSMVESPYNIDMDFGFENDTLTLEPSFPEPVSRPLPRLCLDIEAAMVSSSQLLSGNLPETPEVLKPVLKPGADFDLVNFLLANGDSNNNAVIPTTPTTPLMRPNIQRLQDRRRGKSQLSLSDLKESHKYGRGKPSPLRLEEEQHVTPGPSLVTPSGRPARKSATKFKKLLEEGLLDSTLDSHSISSSDEDSQPKTKRRRTISSSSSRRRLNSDSDLSSICETPSKYRERRDRNNLSSKRSRQKRKVQQELKKFELTELEVENKRLKRRAEKLEDLLSRVKEAWKEYLRNIKKEN